MAIGDLFVGASIPLFNRNAEQDSDCDGIPDGWAVSGAARIRHRAGPTGDLFGLSTLAGHGIEVDTGTAFVSLFTERYALPVPWSGFAAKAQFRARYRCYPGESGKRLTVQAYARDASGAQVGAYTTGTTGSLAEDTFWLPHAFTTPDFTAEVAYLEIRWIRYGTNAQRLIVDSPILLWNPVDLAGGPITLGNLRGGSQLALSASYSMARDSAGAIYVPGAHGIQTGYSMAIRYYRCTEADHAAWMAVFAVNRGQSGFRSANGKQLRPVPVGVAATFGYPDPAAGATPMVQGVNPYAGLEMNLLDVALRHREWPGWGYAGEVALETA